MNELWGAIEYLREEIPRVMNHLEEAARQSQDEAEMWRWSLKWGLWLLPDKWLYWLWNRRIRR